MQFQYGNRQRHRELKQQDFNSNVHNSKSYESYSNEVLKINRNSENKVLTRRLQQEQKEHEIEEALKRVNIHFNVPMGFK